MKRQSQWSKLLLLVVVTLVLVGTSVAWSTLRRQHEGQPPPALIPGTIIRPATR